MKRLSFILSMLLLAFAANAQTYNAHMKNGEVLQLNSSDVEYIDFSASGVAVEAVDLGLPSGLKWANMNVGATRPEEYGDYFAWGETAPQSEKRYSWASYKWCKDGNYMKLTKYCSNSSYGNNGYSDTKTVLIAEDDAATVNWGGDWRMPTEAEFNELLENTTSVWTTVNDVGGYMFTSKTNENSIFLPAAGFYCDSEYKGAGSYIFYWSSSLFASFSFYASMLYFKTGNVYTTIFSRNYGQSIRPVRSK